MNTYWFDIEVAGPVDDEQIDALGARLESAAGIDATVQADSRGGTIMFSREAHGALQAIVSAITDIESVGIGVVGVAEDTVTVDDIAERAGVTAAAVRYWITGDRGPGGFPAPHIDRPRGGIWSWVDVSTWLVDAGLSKVNHIDAEIARARALVNDTLAVRRGVRDLPPHDRPLIVGLVG